MHAVIESILLNQLKKKEKEKNPQATETKLDALSFYVKKKYLTESRSNTQNGKYLPYVFENW